MPLKNQSILNAFITNKATPDQVRRFKWSDQWLVAIHAQIEIRLVILIRY